MNRFLLSLTLVILMISPTLSQDKPLVVVELFTSEGCSSCPPADKLLSEIVNNASQEVEILGLSFHVDYWDYIGWKDPYANKDFTLRQRAYARRFINNTIYTPQMVVNGKHEFLGSSRDKWNRAFSKEINNSLVQLNISSVEIENRRLVLDVNSSQIDQSILNVAVVERGLTQQVTRGENRGRKLSHDNVVRVFDTRQFDGQKNHFELDLPENLNIDNASLIVYSQRQSNWYVNAAQKIKLSDLH